MLSKAVDVSLPTAAMKAMHEPSPRTKKIPRPINTHLSAPPFLGGRGTWAGFGPAKCCVHCDPSQYR